MLEPLRAFRRVRGSFPELTAESFPFSSDYVEVILTDDNPVYNAFNELAAHFSNLASVRQEAFERMAAGTGPKASPADEALSDTKIGRLSGLLQGDARHAAALRDFASFARCILEEPPPEDMVKAFESLLSEAEQELA